MKKYFIYTVAAVVAVLFSLKVSAEGAVFDLQDTGGKYTSSVKIQGQLVEGDSYKTYTSRVHIEAPLHAVMALVRDTDGLPNWVYSCKKSSIEKETAANKALLYMVFSAPLVLSDRDGYLQFNGMVNKEENAFLVTIEGNESYEASEGPEVRMTDVRGRFQAKKSEKGGVDMLFELHVDPGVKPYFAANANTKKIVGDTLENAKELLEGEYQDRKPSEAYLSALRVGF